MDGGQVDLVLVGGDPSVARVLARLLAASASGRSLVWAPDLEGARRLLGAGPQCVLVDLDLPGAGDEAALHEVAALAPEAAVIVLTGHDDEARGVRAVAAGAQDFLEKGATDGRLLERSIRYAVERKRAAVAARRLHETQLRAAENDRLERGLLPRPLLSSGRLRCVTLYEPGGEEALLGGDFFDVVELPDGRVRAVIGDVAGHGPDEAALGVRLRVAWRTLVLAGIDGPGTLAALADLLLVERADPEVFATLCDVELAADQRSLAVTRAGHHPPLLLTREAVAHLAAAGEPPLGVLERTVAFRSARVRLPADWALLLYTDGLVENVVRHEGVSGRLGDEGLARLVADRVATGMDIAEIVTGELARLRDDRLSSRSDDVAIVALAPQERP